MNVWISTVEVLWRKSRTLSKRLNSSRDRHSRNLVILHDISNVIPYKHSDSLIAAGESGKWDFAFIDADKPNYQKYYERCVTLLRSGGVIFIDNVGHTVIPKFLFRPYGVVMLLIRCKLPNMKAPGSSTRQTKQCTKIHVYAICC